MEENDRSSDTAVRNLQTYLRQISYTTPGMTQPPVNGFFGNATRLALEEFQASQDLPVTGQANQITWETLYAAYLDSLRAAGPRERMDIFPRTSGSGKLETGSRGFAVAAVQFMLQRLEQKYGSIGNVEVTGEFTPATAESVKAFQRCNALSPTGVVTDPVWDSMTSQYNLLFLTSD